MPVASKRRQHARHRPSVATTRHKLGAAVPHRGARAAAPIRKKSKQHFPCAPLTLSTKMKPAHATGHPCVPCFPASNSAYGINKRNRRESKDDAKPLRNSEKQPSQEGKKQKSSDLCNFFSISNPFPHPQSENTPSYARLPAVLRFYPHSGNSRRLLIAKKLRGGTFFCFGVPNDLRRRHGHSGARAEPRERPIRVRRLGQGGPDQCSMDRTIGRGAADEAPWGAIWSRFHRRTDAMAPSASNAIAATTVPQAVECDAARTDPTDAP